MTDDKNLFKSAQRYFPARRMVVINEDGSHELVPLAAPALTTPITESERKSLQNYNLLVKDKRLAFLVDSLSDEDWDDDLLIEFYRKHIKPDCLLRTTQAVGIPLTIVTREWVIVRELGADNMVALQDSAGISLVPLLSLLKAGAVNICKQQIVSKGMYEEEVLKKSAELFVEIDKKTGKAVSLKDVYNSED